MVALGYLLILLVQGAFAVLLGLRPRHRSRAQLARVGALPLSLCVFAYMVRWSLGGTDGLMATLAETTWSALILGLLLTFFVTAIAWLIGMGACLLTLFLARVPRRYGGIT
jgi:hypothetical protein